MKASELSSSAVPRPVKWFVYLLSFTAAAYGYFMVLVSSYLPETGLGSGSVGLLLGASGSAMVLGAIPLGMYADKRGKKPVLVWGLLAFTPGLLLFALTTDLVVLMVAAIVIGVTEGAFLSTWNAVIADMTTLENREKAFSLSFIASSLSLGAGLSIPLLFPWVETITHQDSVTVHTWATVGMALLSLLSPIGLSLLLRNYRETIGQRVRMSLEGLGHLWKFSGLNSLVGLGAGFIIPLIATWLLLKFAVTDAHSGPLLAVANLTIGLAAVASPALSRRYGTVNAIVLSQGMSTVFMLSLVATQSAVLAGAVYVARSALMNMSVPLADSFLMGIVPTQQRSLASAVNSLVWRLPNSVSTVIGGTLLEAGMYDLPIFLATTFYAASITGFYLVFRKVSPKS